MPWYGKLYDRVQISANGYLVLLPSLRQPGGPEDISEEAVAAAAAPGALGNTNSTHECCAELDGIHTEHDEAVIAPYYTDLDPTIMNKERSSGVWAVSHPLSCASSESLVSCIF